MGGSRLNDLPENGLIRVLVDARRTSSERKGSAQQVGGANLAYFGSESAGTFDWSGRVDSVLNPGFSQARFVITLTAKTAVVPLADLALELFYSPDGTNWEPYGYDRTLSDMFPATPPSMWQTFRTMPAVANAPHEVKFSFQLVGDHNTRMAFKCQAFSTDEVTIHVERIA